LSLSFHPDDLLVLETAAGFSLCVAVEAVVVKKASALVFRPGLGFLLVD